MGVWGRDTHTRLRNLLDNFKCVNIRIIGVPEGEEGEQEMVAKKTEHY